MAMLSASVGNPPQKEAASYFKGNKDRRNICYTSCTAPTWYFWYAEWQFEIRILICTNNILFTIYHFTW